MKLSHVFGISPEDAARLGQANVRTLLDLATARDLAAVSASSDIPLGVLERWQVSAADRMAVRRRRRTVVSIVALITAILAGGIAIWSHKKGISPALDQAIVEYNRGNALRDGDNFDAAADAYRKALSIKPNYPQAYYNLCAALREAGNYETAAGHSEAAARHYDAAKDQCVKALALYPTDPSLHNAVGDVYLDEGKFDDAIKEQEKAVALAPTYTYAWNDLAVALKEKYDGEKPPNVATLRRLLQVLVKILELQTTPGAQRLPPDNFKSIEQLKVWALGEVARLKAHN